MNGEFHGQNNHDDESPGKLSIQKGNGYHKQQHQLFKKDEIGRELPMLYYSQIKKLNHKISYKLCLKLDEFKLKHNLINYERDIDSPRSPKPFTLPPELDDSGSTLGKRKRNFEEDMFDEYNSNITTAPEFEDDRIFDSSINVKSPMDLMVKLKNINFEVLNEQDTRPIMKKLKTSEVKVISSIAFILSLNNTASCHHLY